MDPSQRKCGACKVFKDLDSTQFSKMRDGKYAAVCKQCANRRAEKRRDKKRADAPGNDSDSENDEDARVELGNVNMDDFIHSIQTAEDVQSFTALVEDKLVHTTGDVTTAKERANSIAIKIWEQLKYRFVYHSCYERKRTASTRYIGSIPATQVVENGDQAEDEGDLLEKVDHLLDKNSTDSEDGPDWMFDDEETLSPDPEYIFCPAPHRKQALHLFTKHFCQHPIFPERHSILSAPQIRSNAVKEMYDFCQVRGLRELWGYMWTSWYTPKMWAIWARSTSPLLSRLRTTMTVENFWRQLKHNYLHNYARPRLDHLVWILIYKVTPDYFSRMGRLLSGYRLGRSKELSPYQRCFKSSWKKMLATTIKNSYVTDVLTWKCNCGSQKYNCHHLCKHLVQAVGAPPSSFWQNVTRRRTSPIYSHPSLVPMGPSLLTYSDPDGTITDGDDRDWYGNLSLLEDSGGWEDLLPSKRTHSPVIIEDLNSSKRIKTEGVPEDTTVIDLTLSSPTRASSEAAFSDSSAFDYGSDDELKLDELCEDIEDQIKAMDKATTILRDQLANRNRLWLKSAKEAIGNNVSTFVSDIDAIERGKKRGTTWAKGRTQEDKRRAKISMGYMYTAKESAD